MPSITKFPQRPTKDNFHVLVIGAGTTGLLLAQGLKKHGISCAVYERSDSTTYVNRQRDWTMALHWGSDFIRHLVPDDIVDDLPTVQPDPFIQLTEEQETIFPMIDAQTGKPLLSRKERTTRRASREKLRNLLARHLDINYGKKLVNLQHDRPDGKVVAEFADGTFVSGDAIVGADSVNSRVRNYLLGDKAQLDTMPVIAYNFTCYYTEEQAKYLRWNGHPLMKSGMHQEQNSFYMIPTMDIGDDTDPKTWKFQHFFNVWAPDTQHLETSEERLAHFKSLAGQYAEPFKSAALWVPEDTYVPGDRIRHWTGICEWPNFGGRITLAGDAAHPMCPYRGQGMNNGLHDAANYVAALNRALEGEASLEEVIGEYDAELLTRGAREIRTSAIQGYSSMHPQEHLLDSPVAHHGFRKIDYENNPVKAVSNFDDKVKVPEAKATAAVH